MDRWPSEAPRSILARLGFVELVAPRSRTVIGSLKFTSEARLMKLLRLTSFGFFLTARSSFARSAARARGPIPFLALAADTRPRSPPQPNGGNPPSPPYP